MMVTLFLLVWDDNNNEAIFSKNARSESSTLLQILRYFIIEASKDKNFMSAENEISTGSASTRTTESICAISNKLSIVSLLLGVFSVRYRSTGSAQVRTQRKDPSQNFNFRFSLSQQDCRYICPSKVRYRAPRGCWAHWYEPLCELPVSSWRKSSQKTR